jgi:hypothetical protein
MLIDCIVPKWNPTAPNLDLSDNLALSEEELEWNQKSMETDHIMVFDPKSTLTSMAGGFRIFAFEESLDEISTKRYKLPGQQPILTAVFLHACIRRPGEFEPLIES